MEWHQYLRAECARKREGLDLFSANKLVMMEVRGDERVNANGRTVAQLQKDITDIEDILLAAGQPLDVNR